jgi:hypothetical protein
MMRAHITIPLKFLGSGIGYGHIAWIIGTDYILILRRQYEVIKSIKISQIDRYLQFFTGKLLK